MATKKKPKPKAEPQERLPSVNMVFRLMTDWTDKHKKYLCGEGQERRTLIGSNNFGHITMEQVIRRNYSPRQMYAFRDWLEHVVYCKLGGRVAGPLIKHLTRVAVAPNREARRIFRDHARRCAGCGRNLRCGLGRALAHLVDFNEV